MVEYLLEAKKFIECARAAYSAEARDQDLDMAEWCITRAIEEAGHKPPQQAAAKSAGRGPPSRTNDQEREQLTMSAYHPSADMLGAGINVC
jgi:hypothetical protein